MFWIDGTCSNGHCRPLQRPIEPPEPSTVASRSDYHIPVWQCSTTHRKNYATNPYTISYSYTRSWFYLAREWFQRVADKLHWEKHSWISNFTSWYYVSTFLFLFLLYFFPVNETLEYIHDKIQIRILYQVYI